MLRVFFVLILSCLCVGECVCILGLMRVFLCISALVG